MTQSDVLTFGETMLRYSPPGGQRLAQATAFDVCIAGSESNVAAALCALGCSATWVSRLPDGPLGRRVEADLRARGVDVTQVVWAPAEERLGTYYAELGAEPRAGVVIYDRAGSAAAALSPADLPDSLFASHRHLHVSGITPGLSATCARTVTDAIHRAKSRGLTVSFDVNYRARLWSPDAAAAALTPLLKQADIVLCSRDDAGRLFGLAGDDRARAEGLRARFGARIAAVTCGADGAVAASSDGVWSVPAIPLETAVGRFGSGDAFAGGFLTGFLEGAALEDCLRLGVAAAALKRTIPGDMLIATRAEIDAVLGGEDNAAWR